MPASTSPARQNTTPAPARIGRPASLLGLTGLALCTLYGCSTAPQQANRTPPVQADAPHRPSHAVAAVQPPSSELPPLVDPSPGRDGAPANPPLLDLLSLPDPEPMVEPIRAGGPNKPYEVSGWTYVPETSDVEWKQSGLASWYGKKFHGKRTASGEVYNLYGMTAAHVTLPIPSYARVRNVKNGKSVIVRINDRGPFSRDRIIDLSYTAAAKLDLLHGVGSVEIERITHESIREGRWKSNGADGDEATRYELAQDRLSPPSAVKMGRTEPERRTAANRPPAGVAPAGSSPDRLAGSAATPEAASPARATAPAALAAQIAPAASTKPPTGPLTALQSERAGTSAARGWWLQLGAFQSQDGADSFYRQVGDMLKGLDPLLAMFQEQMLHKIQAGPFATRDEATKFGTRLREMLRISPVLVERK